MRYIWDQICPPPTYLPGFIHTENKCPKAATMLYLLVLELMQKYIAELRTKNLFFSLYRRMIICIPLHIYSTPCVFRYVSHSMCVPLLVCCPFRMNFTPYISHSVCITLPVHPTPCISRSYVSHSISVSPLCVPSRVFHPVCVPLQVFPAHESLTP